ncbi:16S rRNA (cytidine(1402)-2'-O)-methyltransferase [Acaryochloris marina]|uniref:Ribosomal RNA small subunit methyltransferase I n=1 Tax=Acaryochloris marina (strain MBIC 11017) TaxID=329726 RepID=B0C1A3_ACAM1|nr:16S rRNA (cytidine(1402)-2'-O)-methyltransferase [Acaryochloris marina]ABW28501.1 tetrapyrrole methylase family protein [Acaryochloris marina MBIC11017]BDM77502.1 ribosomal RNA small subunit methyltransferase I [Acaryochloris marina MBIC10699]
MTSSETNTSQNGSLYIVATPIGNLEDMSFRAVRILQTVAAIAAEDTRHTGKLLHHFQIKTPQISYHQHNTQTRTQELIQRLESGQDLALVSDAGMPGISDPGVELVQACVEVGIEVIPIPGANAAIAALVASGLPCDRFCFEGFLPAKGKARQQRLQDIATESRTVVLYEAPHRLRQTLKDLAEQVSAERQIVLARELTKRFEEFWRGSVQAAITHYQSHEPKGEFTVVLAGAVVSKTLPTDLELRTELQALLAQGWSKSRASRQLAEKHAMSRRQIYQLTLDLE